jgi:hypothetical protein
MAFFSRQTTEVGVDKEDNSYLIFVLARSYNGWFGNYSYLKWERHLPELRSIKLDYLICIQIIFIICTITTKAYTADSSALGTRCAC